MIIKFNLIPKKEKPEKEVYEEKPKFLKIFTIFLLIFIGSIVFLTIKIEREITYLEKEKKKKNELLIRYKTIANKVKELEKRNEETEKRIKIIVALKEKQSITLKQLSTLFMHAQSNKVFFKNFHMNDTHAKIKGMSYDIDLLANYMNNLENNKDIIKLVTLKSAETKNVGLISLYDFELEVTF